MWKHIRVALTAGTILGGGAYWLATNSITQTIEGADGYFYQNLRWLGWQNPPDAIASHAANHTIAITGAAIALLGCLACISWLFEWLFKRTRRKPNLFDDKALEGLQRVMSGEVKPQRKSVWDRAQERLRGSLLQRMIDENAQQTEDQNSKHVSRNSEDAPRRSVADVLFGFDIEEWEEDQRAEREVARLRKIAEAKRWQPPHIEQTAPDLPINANSLGAYIRGFPRVRGLTKEICTMLDRPLDESERNASFALVEKAAVLGFDRINQLDEAIAADEVLILRIAPYFIPEKIYHDYSLKCFFFVIGGRLGADEYWKRIKSLEHTSTSKKFCEELEEVYGLITQY